MFAVSPAVPKATSMRRDPKAQHPYERPRGSGLVELSKG